MSGSKHTPGPWMAWQPRADESVPVRTDGLGITIAYVHQGAITNAKANASLIAAAPELLDALKGVMRAYSEPDSQICCSGHHCGCMGATLRDQANHYASEAIAKAEGRS